MGNNQVSLLSGSQFFPSQKLARPKALKVTSNEDRQIVITNTNEDYQQGYIRQRFLNFRKYRIVISYNQIYQEDGKLAFGLIKTSDKDSSNGWNIYCSTYSGYSNPTGKVLKGVDFKQQPFAKVRRFEIRVEIQKKIWKVASLPNYKNVSELNDPNLIDPNGFYNLVICMLTKDESVTIEEIAEVEEFDNKM